MLVRITSLKKQLSKSFAMKDLGQAKQILGMKIKKVQRFRMENAKAISCLLTNHFKLSSTQYPSIDGEKEEMKKIPYASAVRSLMYPMVYTRPDIARSVGVGSRGSRVVAVKITETCKELLCMKKFLNELEIHQERYQIFCDSQSAIHFGKNSSFHLRSKQIGVRYHWISLITFWLQSTRKIIAASRYGSATPIPPSVLSRGIGWPGMGTLLAGLCGTGSGLTASVESAGLLGLTRVGSRRVIEISAGSMFFFSVLGKFGAILASIPLPIVAALYCVLFAYVASAGIGFLQFCNLNSFRTKFVLGFALFMGLSVPQYFNEYLLISGHSPFHTHAILFNNIMQVIFSSSATVAIIVAFLLDCTHSFSHSSTWRDSGRHWWVKFWKYDQDTRTEDFYSLPWNLNRFFPSF
ncbi:nucleobase-ascorbate transporter 4-like [Jatropha curcas]|uniref:nucleobase-ascorbate transporter 4-like n=1 Tax=Jatropha curcas TaxID=180498 RepID=UPI0018943A00|nr:nucleobase-ascorbate transporter 4-like [Jatropha curcas]